MADASADVADTDETDADPAPGTAGAAADEAQLPTATPTEEPSAAADDEAESTEISELSLSSCEGRTCFGHGKCVITSGKATCQCEPGYYASGLSCLPGAVDPGSKFVPAGYKLVFSDELNGATLDTTKWSTRAPWNVQWFEDSNQLQAFIPEAVKLGGGVARLVASKSKGNTAGQPYASGSLTTKRTFTRGYFEARVKVPAGKGFWPAFWLTSATRWPPEWDIFEIVNGVNHMYLHPLTGGKRVRSGGIASTSSTYVVPNQYGINHIYGFEWTSTQLSWFVDGVLIQRYAVDATSGINDPCWLNLSLQVGGDWPGSPDASTPFPSEMTIDYVRIYQR